MIIGAMFFKREVPLPVLLYQSEMGGTSSSYFAERVVGRVDCQPVSLASVPGLLVESVTVLGHEYLENVV